jgi:hypothetical protein
MHQHRLFVLFLREKLGEKNNEVPRVEQAAFLFQKMGLRGATAAEVTRAKEAGTPGVVNQWDPKLRVGPDERPAKINAYGFDTGSDGYWVVPVDGN